MGVAVDDDLETRHMSSAFDKLRRILVLEREQGCRNRAVIGGLERFLTYWEKEARSEAAQVSHPVAVSEVVSALAGYADAPFEVRVQTVDHLVNLLARNIAMQKGNETAQGNDEPAADGNEGATCCGEAKQQVGAGSDKTISPAVVDPASVATVDTLKASPRAPEGVSGTVDGESQEPGRAVEPEAAWRTRPPRAALPQETWDSPVTVLKGVGPVNDEHLAQLGVHTIKDLLYHFPRRYDDFAELKTINRLALGDEVTILGIIAEVKAQRTRTGQTLVRALVGDGTGTIEARWFGQPYLEKSLELGSEIVISGKVDEYLGRLLFSSPEWEPLQRDLLHTARLVPVYPLTEGIGARWLRRLIKATLDSWVPGLVDPLPRSLLDSGGLLDFGSALQQMHFPDSPEALERARQRLCFDEFLLVQLGVLRQRRGWRSQVGRAIEIVPQALETFAQRLPFTLTGAQERALRAILADLAQSVPMSRLLQGDVGSGKTVVAAAAILAVVQSGLQAALMAPTTILATQHHRVISRLLQAFPEVRCELLMGSLSASEKERLHREVAEGQVQVVVGTQALIQSTVEFARLGLVVVDEQHRFGVLERSLLRAKGSGFQPHLLAMSATPIPRTLAMTIYGDLDLAVLDELPPNRQQVTTAVRDGLSRERIYSFLNSQIEQGHQAFIVCPLVEGSDKIEAKAAVDEFQHLQREIFPNLRLGLLHGRMGAEEKEQAMMDFANGLRDILVSTSVVEVGIDVPNATVILIEGAERFGLSQLHQFRGRVGRGEARSYCILLSDDPSEESLKRLQIMEETCDGFLLAEKDLELRGPGDFFGVRQHGLPNLRVARLSDTAILEKARVAAARIFEDDPDLAKPAQRLLAANVRQFWASRELPEVEVTP